MKKTYILNIFAISLGFIAFQCFAEEAFTLRCDGTAYNKRGTHCNDCDFTYTFKVDLNKGILIDEPLQFKITESTDRTLVAERSGSGEININRITGKAYKMRNGNMEWDGICKKAEARF